MKQFVLAVTFVGVVAGLGFSVHHRMRNKIEVQEAAALAEQREKAIQQETVRRRTPIPLTESAQPASAPSSDQVAVPTHAAEEKGGGVRRHIDTLLSAQSSFADKQGAWKELMRSGRLDEAISELEQRLANDGQVPQFSAVLGEAYIKKCAQTDDVREQAILAMKGDQHLETALNLDPANWDARFTKAVAMAHWPEQLNKRAEVISDFKTLIQQQEGEPPRPEFAKPYLWLGEQYQKAGKAEQAAQTWTEGASLFPNDPELRKKLVSTPSSGKE